MAFIILLFFILLFILIIFYKYSLNIIFISPHFIADIIRDNKYILNMSDQNLKFRNISDKIIYNILLNNKFYNPSDYEKILIKFNIYKANAFFKNIKYPWFDGSKLNNLPWNIACANEDYEFGFPHTMKDIIILNKTAVNSNHLYKTLVHERIHIYQRLYPNDIELFLKTYNFIKISKLSDDDRMNPDTNEFKYSKDNIIYECKIKNNKIKCTGDNYTFEHPYEYMAYILTNNL